MAKSTSYIRQNKQTSAMSPPHAHTSGIVSSMHQLEDDDDDDDICPICEGACTCNNKTAPPIPASLASSSRQTHIQPSPQLLPSPSVHAYPAAAAPLKIKLTIPPTLLARSRCPTSDDPKAPSKKQNKRTDAHSRDNRLVRTPKAGGRSTVHRAATSKAKDKRVPKLTSLAKDMTEEPSNKIKVGGRDDSRGGIGSAPRRRSHKTGAGNSAKPDSQFTQNQRFPTFVSADEFSSANESSAGSSSSSEESELTEFSDSSIAEEEEIYIRTTEEQRAHDKARVKRELLGDGTMNRMERRNDWEIRSRKKSVGPSDDDMDVDSDESDDEAEDVEEAEGNDGEDEDEDDAGPVRGSYVGIATGWSEDEESSFDAELFFAGLSDSESGPEITTVPDQDAAASDNDSSADIGSSVLAQGTFEITEGWDGSVIFSNGLQDGQGLLDWDFEANAAQLLIEASTMSESNSGSDIRMAESEGDMGDSEDETDGLEEVESNDGNTTEEELVDDRGLPTARAMRLFRCPVTPLYAIDPLSTMNRGPPVTDGVSIQSPRPSDILAGREFGDEDDDAPEPPLSEISSIILSASSDRGTPRPPLMGMFEASKTNSLHRAIIDGTPHAVPSPFQRNSRRRASESISARSFSRGRDRSLSLSHASFTTTPVPFGLPSLSDEPTLHTPSGLPAAELIRLDDVLDTSILDSDTVDASTTPGQPRDTIGDPEASADDGERYLQSLSRWDRIPMGTFRRTRENYPLSDGTGDLSFGNIIRNSPFTGVWPSDRNHGQSSGTPSKKSKGKKRGSLNRVDMDISPVILPVHDRDGDHTPTGHATGQTCHGPLHSKPRKDKESRRDKMLKRKTLMGTSIGRRHQQNHHPHNHHPNSKGRASGSMQRTGVFTGSVPPLNL